MGLDDIIWAFFPGKHVLETTNRRIEWTSETSILFTFHIYQAANVKSQIRVHSNKDT